MNTSPQPDGADSGSASPGDHSTTPEVRLQSDPSPPREQLGRGAPEAARTATPPGGLAANDWPAAPPPPEVPEPSSRWARTPRWLKVISTTAVGLVVIGSLAAALVWRQYSMMAETYDLERLPRLAEGTRVVDREGQFVGTVFSNDRKFISLEQVPQHLLDALIATEDAKFYKHGGIDFKAIGRAALANLSQGSIRQGGSTITQQLARQTFGLRQKSIQRKLLEASIAVRIEDNFSKEQILEFYLNQIYLGSGYYGIGAAARGYFGKEVRDLEPHEAALLVGIIKAPVSYSPFRAPDAALRARNLTLDRMQTLGFLSAEEAFQIKAAPMKVLAEGERPNRPEYLLAAVERELTNAGSGKIPREVALTIDQALQVKLGEVLPGHLEQLEQKFAVAEADPGAAAAPPLQGAVIVINNVSGEILATIGGRDYRTSPFDRALQGKRAAGTAFLPLSYAAMITATPEVASLFVLDGPLDNRRVMVGGTEGILGEWGVEWGNNVYEGHVSAAYALLRGKTGASVRLGYQAGIEATRAGLERCDFQTPLRDQASVVLGASAVRLSDMARAYAALANGGRMPPRPYLMKAKDAASDQPVEEPAAVFSQPAADLVRAVMVGTLQQQEMQDALWDARLAETGLAGYGGTAYGFTDAWYIGSDKNITCAVWVGYDDGRPIGKVAFSRDTAFPLWAEVMTVATGGRPQGWPPSEEGPALCLRSGAAATEACVHKERRLVVSGAVPTPGTSCDYHKETPEVAQAALGAGEIVKAAKTARKQEREEPVGVSPVKPQEPVVVGADIYRSIKPPAKTVE